MMQTYKKFPRLPKSRISYLYHNTGLGLKSKVLRIQKINMKKIIEDIYRFNIFFQEN